MEETSNVCGMDGDGVLIGRNKADTLIGADDDTYIVDAAGDAIINKSSSVTVFILNPSIFFQRKEGVAICQL